MFTILLKLPETNKIKKFSGNLFKNIIRFLDVQLVLELMLLVSLIAFVKLKILT